MPSGVRVTDLGVVAEIGAGDYAVALVNGALKLVPTSLLGGVGGGEPDGTPPAIPTGLTGEGADTGVVLNWNDNAEPDLDHYEYRVDGGTPVTAATSDATVTGLTNGVTYTFEVRAVDTSDNASDWTAAVIIRAGDYAGLVLDDSPIAYWRLNETSGTNGNDEVGTADATVTGATWATGRLGNGLTYDGINDYSLHTALSTLGPALKTGATFEMWIKVPSGTTAGSYFSGVFNDGSTTNFMLGINTADSTAADFTPSSGSTSLYTRDDSNVRRRWWTKDLPYDGQWHHLAFVVQLNDALSEQRVKIYVDGIRRYGGLAASAGGAVGTMSNFGYPLAFGARNLRGVIDSFSPVSLDEIAVYTSALTWDQIDAHLNGVANVVGTMDGTAAVRQATETQQVIVDIADIAGATELREQDDIVYDPNDPNLGTNPERLWKHYFTYIVGSNPIKRVGVVFSADGETWTTPTLCTRSDSTKNMEDPSVVTLLDTPGEVYRDGDGKMHLYCENVANDEIDVWESVDGIAWTLVASSVIPKVGSTWEATLTGSPVARFDGTNYIVGYEGIGLGLNCLGVASGATPGSLTKSANNPVFKPDEAGFPPYIIDSIVVDAFFLSTDGTKIWLIAHDGMSLQTNPPGTVFRAYTANLDPTTWELGDIIPAGIIGNVRNDITIDHTAGDFSRVITAPEDDQMIIRRTLYEQ